MAYQVYFGNLTEENQALVLTLLRLKEESGKLEPGEAELLTTLRGSAEPLPPPPPPPPESPVRQPQRHGQRRPFPRRGSGNGRGLSANGAPD